MKNYALSLTSAFNSSNILKFRILMMYQQNSPQIALTKFLWAIPVIVLCVLVSALVQRNSTTPQVADAPAPHPTPATYTIFSSVMLEAHTPKRLRYYFTKDKEYMFLFLDLKTQKPVSPPKDFKVWDLEAKEVQNVQLANALHYSYKDNGEYTVEVTNANDMPILLKIYARPKKVMENKSLEKKLYTQPFSNNLFAVPDTTKEGC